MRRADARALIAVLLGLLCAALRPVAAAQPAAAPPQRPIHIGFLYSDGNLPGTLKAYQSLLRAHPQLRGQVTLTALTESTFDAVRPDDLLQADVLVLDMMNEQLLTRFDKEHGTDLLKRVGERGTVLAVGQGLRDEKYYVGLGAKLDPRLQAYWQHGGARNQLGLLEGALSIAGVRGLTLPEPERSLDFGYYYPDANGGQVFATWEAFDAWRNAHGKRRPGAPRIAVTFFKAAFYSGDDALLTALVAEIERQGGEAVPAFGYPGAVSVDRLLRDAQGRPRADAILGSNLNFADSQSADLLERAGMPAINLITLYGRSEADWRGSPSGLSNFEGTFNLAVPEFAGTIAPTVVASKEKRRDAASGLENVVTTPIAPQVKLAVARAIRYARLRSTPNAAKRIALLHYNFPPGKASIGASYLNVAESLANVLARLEREGYDLGGPAPDAARVLEDITRRARNVAGDAPGELAELLREGGAARVPVTRYRQWLQDYAPSLRAKIEQDWGDAASGKLMIDRSSPGGPAFVIPQVRYGKVILLPQPARAWGEDLDKLYHAKDLAPHPQYVATYEWLKRDFKADAIVHVGTHGTLEWLDGKDAGLSPQDAPDALIGDLPNLYIYNVDVVGEGLVARRRSMATLVDHMVPPFRKGGLSPDLAALNELLNDHTVNETKNPQLAAAFAKQARERAVQLGVAKDLGLDPAREWTDEELHRVEGYLTTLRGQNIPYGLHAFGRTPEESALRSTVDAIVAVDRSLLPDQQRVLAGDMTKRITDSGPRELDSLLAALGGRVVPSGTGGEPLRNPSSYATGRNFYGIDPDKVPKKASWEMGVKLGEQMLAEHLQKHGRYPEKVSFVIWGDETMRHEGVLESQIFWLLGTKPVWDARGKVVGVEVIPRAQLERPRIDIIIASAAEGMFSNVTRLMDEAVQKVKAIDEADNLVRRHYLATRATLIARGRSPEDADRLAGVRIFDEPPGTFNLNTSSIVAASGTWDTDAGFANDYIRKMGHGYGNGFHGEAMEDVFRLALGGVDKVVHSSSTTLYGALDNDDMYMYMGGLAAAVRSIDGRTPEMVVTNTRDPSKPEMTSLDRFIGQEFRSRYVNPTWIEGMKKEGYAGAAEMRAFVEYLWGWDATVTDVVDDAMWQKTFSVYVQDEHDLKLKQFFEEKSPFAYQDITARMIETVRKGHWQADEATRSKLLNEYLQSVARHGVNCTENSCGNSRLLRYVLDNAAAARVPAPVIAQARAAMEKAMGESVESAAARLEAFVARNERRERPRAEARQDQRAPQEQGAQTGSRATAPQAAQGPPANASAATPVRGYVMDQESRSATPSASAPPATDAGPWRALTWGVPLLLVLLAWQWRERQRRRRVPAG